MNSSKNWKIPKLLIGAVVRGHIGTVDQKIAFVKSILQTLDEVSPWALPMQVSGVTEAASEIEIDENYGQFSLKTLKAMASAVPSINIKEPEAIDSDDIEKIGLENSDITFVSKQEGLSNSEIWVNFNLAGTLSPNPFNGITITIQDYIVSGQNNWWGQSENAMIVISSLIDLIEPCTFEALDTSTRFKALERNVDRYTMSWLSYTTNPVFVKALLEFSESKSFKNGVLVKLADTVEMSCTEKVFNRISQIRDHLRYCNATNWLEET